MIKNKNLKMISNRLDELITLLVLIKITCLKM